MAKLETRIRKLERQLQPSTEPAKPALNWTAADWARYQRLWDEHIEARGGDWDAVFEDLMPELREVLREYETSRTTHQDT